MSPIEYEKEVWRQPTVLESDKIIFSEHGRIANNVDFRSHWLVLVKAQYGGHFLLVKHGGGEERISLGYDHVCNALDALGQVTEDQRYLILYCLYTAHKNATYEAREERTGYFHRAFLEGRLKRRKRDHRVYCDVQPQAKEVIDWDIVSAYKRKRGDDMGKLTAYDHPESKYRNPHVLLNKVAGVPKCGCTVEDFGTILQPIVIVFCPLHAAALRMRNALHRTQEALDVLADDAEEAGYPRRAQAATKQAMKIRALLRKIDGKEII